MAGRIRPPVPKGGVQADRTVFFCDVCADSNTFLGERDENVRVQGTEPAHGGGRRIREGGVSAGRGQAECPPEKDSPRQRSMYWRRSLRCLMFSFCRMEER